MRLLDLGSFPKLHDFMEGGCFFSIHVGGSVCSFVEWLSTKMFRKQYIDQKKVVFSSLVF